MLSPKRVKFTLNSHLVSLKILRWLLFLILSLINFCNCRFMHKAVERVKRRFDDPFIVQRILRCVDTRQVIGKQPLMDFLYHNSARTARSRPCPITAPALSLFNKGSESSRVKSGLTFGLSIFCIFGLFTVDIRCNKIYHHSIMSRTTINIDDPILKEIKRLQKKEGRSIGKIISQLLADALAQRKAPKETPKLQWISRPMHVLVDLSDKDEVYAILDSAEK